MDIHLVSLCAMVQFNGFMNRKEDTMNKAELLGRLTRDPEIRYTQGNNQTCVARFTLAVDRRFKQQGGPDADFISCIAFGKTGEFFEKYVKQGTKIAVVGRIQTGSFEKQDGTKVYTTDVVVEEAEFAESKKASGQQGQTQVQQAYAQPQQGFAPQQPQQGFAPQQAPAQPQYQQQTFTQAAADGFMNPDSASDEGLPFR